jgi:putative membrane protein
MRTIFFHLKAISMKWFFRMTAIAALFFCITNISLAQNPSLTDPEVASVAVAANQIDIKYAEIAKKKSKNQEVINFAQTMMNDHQAVIDKASALVKKLNVTPKDNSVSQKLNSDATNTRKELQTKSGKEFDKAYIDNEVTYHKAVIDAVKNLLIPETENQELKGLLESILPALNAHLEHAEMVQKKVSQ